MTYSAFKTPETGWRRVLHKLWFSVLLILAAITLSSIALSLKELEFAVRMLLFWGSATMLWLILRLWIGWVAR